MTEIWLAPLPKSRKTQSWQRPWLLDSPVAMALVSELSWFTEVMSKIEKGVPPKIQSGYWEFQIFLIGGNLQADRLCQNVCTNSCGFKIGLYSVNRMIFHVETYHSQFTWTKSFMRMPDKESSITYAKVSICREILFVMYRLSLTILLIASICYDNMAVSCFCLYYINFSWYNIDAHECGF